jgi:putative ABC transport system permease protein
VVNVEAFGWRLPMQVFPWDWLRLLGWTFLAALIAGLFPALRLMRRQPSDLLRVFADER